MWLPSGGVTCDRGTQTAMIDWLTSDASLMTSLFWRSVGHIVCDPSE